MRLRTGELLIRAQDESVVYQGKPCPDAIQEALKEEHEQVRYAIHNWLRHSDVFGSGWHLVPINAPQLAPHIHPAGSRSLRV